MSSLKNSNRMFFYGRKTVQQFLYSVTTKEIAVLSIVQMLAIKKMESALKQKERISMIEEN